MFSFSHSIDLSSCSGRNTLRACDNEPMTKHAMHADFHTMTILIVAGNPAAMFAHSEDQINPLPHKLVLESTQGYS